MLEGRADLKWPASLYLEGSDQHRGWFHSSLLESCGTRGRAPYDAVLTHGFVMAEDGRKMSKSLGNQVTPQQVIEQSGADILRLWVVSSDYAEDLRIGPEILKTNVNSYRKLRNTIRWMLGSLAHFRPEYRVAEAEMPELERLMLSELVRLDGLVREAYEAFDFKRIYFALFAFMTNDLSAFYFDIRKDRLYCDPASSKDAARGADGDRHPVRLPRALARADASFHLRRGMGRAPRRSRARCILSSSATCRRSGATTALEAKWERVLRLRRVVLGGA